MKIIAYYTGSDARWLIHTFPTDIRKIPYILFVRLRAYLMKPFVSEYWVDHNYLRYFIFHFNPKAKMRVVPDTLLHIEKYPKRKHLTKNVMYYYPANEYNKTYCRWCYGKDIIDTLKSEFTDFNWIRVDGKLDMKKVFPVIDFYIRPNRHDGASRLVQECEIQGIPYYHSHHDPDIDEIRTMLKEKFYGKN